jgi:hypothetical protein
MIYDLETKARFIHEKFLTSKLGQEKVNRQAKFTSMLLKFILLNEHANIWILLRQNTN